MARTHHHLDPGCRDDPLQTLGWIRGIQGNIGTARPQDPQKSHHKIWRTLQEDAYPGLRATTPRTQLRGQSCRAKSQLAIAQVHLVTRQGHSPGTTGGLLQEKLVETGSGRCLGR